MNIYVGNLSYEVTEEDLNKAFAAYGEVASSKVIKDQYSGRSKGFAFIEMPNNEEAEAAINGLNNKELKGRVVKVNQANPRRERGDGGGRGKQGNYNRRRY